VTILSSEWLVRKDWSQSGASFNKLQRLSKGEKSSHPVRVAATAHFSLNTSFLLPPASTANQRHHKITSTIDQATPASQEAIMPDQTTRPKPLETCYSRALKNRQGVGNRRVPKT